MFAHRFYAKRMFATRYFPPKVASGGNTGAGRIEFTMPRNRFEFTVDGRFEFTVPKSRDEYAER